MKFFVFAAQKYEEMPKNKSNSPIVQRNAQIVQRNSPIIQGFHLLCAVHTWYEHPDSTGRPFLCTYLVYTAAGAAFPGRYVQLERTGRPFSLYIPGMYRGWSGVSGEVCTAGTHWKAVFVYIPGMYRGWSGLLPEVCTTRLHCMAVFVYIPRNPGVFL